MTFHSDLTLDAVWPTDIRTALGGAANSVTVGRRSQKVPNLPFDVSIEPGPVEEKSPGAYSKRRAHPYILRVRVRAKPGGNLTGEAVEGVLDGHMRTLSERYHARRPFAPGTLSDLITVTASELARDDSAESEAAEGTLAVTFYTREV